MIKKITENLTFHLQHDNIVEYHYKTPFVHSWRINISFYLFIAKQYEDIF